MGDAPNDAITPKKPVRRRDRRGTEAAFVSAAAAIFAERGFENATTKAIAEQAGFSEALIQTYFNGKEGLLIAVMAKEMSDVGTDVSFFARPLCSSIEEEARETLIHFVGSLSARSTRLRIVLSRVFIDAQFKAEYGRLTYRRILEANLLARLARYVDARLLDRDADTVALSGMLACLSFELGFTHPNVLDTPAEAVERMIPAFASIIGRAFPWRRA